MSKVKANFERAQMLKDWHEGGAGVMILGYDMYRNLVQGSHCKNKKQKKTFFECLADPGRRFQGSNFTFFPTGRFSPVPVFSTSEIRFLLAFNRNLIISCSQFDIFFYNSE